jgi:rSAM/selenodomain-associated transferase 1
MNFTGPPRKNDLKSEVGSRKSEVGSGKWEVGSGKHARPTCSDEIGELGRVGNRNKKSGNHPNFSTHPGNSSGCVSFEIQAWQFSENLQVFLAKRNSIADSMKTDALIIFIKNPERGKVKTRLASTVGDDQALAVYRALLTHTRRLAESLDVVDRLLFYSAFIDRDDDWPASSFEKFLQRGPDLGARMHQAFITALSDHEKAVIIGSDCPSLTADIIQEAFAQLDQHDFVIGPAEDGGYYLLGMKEVHPQLFFDITWSTSAVFSTTMERIEALGKSCHRLPELSDIDNEEDWKKHGWELD